jgi:hypothetical protein
MQGKARESKASPRAGETIHQSCGKPIEEPGCGRLGAKVSLQLFRIAQILGGNAKALIYRNKKRGGVIAPQARFGCGTIAKRQL